MYELLELFGLEGVEDDISLPLTINKDINVLREKEKEYYERYYG